MSCNHEWSEECYDVVPSQVCVRCNAFQVEEEHAELVRDAYKRGAEAMREACLGVVERFMDLGSPHPMMIAHRMSALPLPEDK